MATTSGQPWTIAFDTCQFLTIEVLSAVSFYNATLNVNKTALSCSLQNKYAREFLARSHSDHFHESIKQN